MRRSRYTLFSEVALCALVAAMPLALGGAPIWALWPLVVLSGAATVFAAIGARREGQPLRLPLIGLGVALAAAFCAVQLIPWPAPILRLLSPPAAELRDFALAPIGLSASGPISVDPPATWRELAKHLAYLGAFLSALHVSAHRRARRRLLAAIALTGTAVSLLGLVHKLLNLPTLFGGTLLSTQPPLVTTFGNPNHLAGYLILASTVGLGLALRAESRERSWFWGLGYLLMGAGVLLSLSRGGIFFFVLGQLFLAGLVALKRPTDKPVSPRRTRMFGALAALVCVLGVSAYIGYSEIVSELETADSIDKLKDSKIALWPSMARTAWEYARAGMGRGAFAEGYTRFQAVPDATFEYAENLVLQLAAEFGLAGALVLLAIGLIGFGRIAQGLLKEGEEPSPSELAAAVGVVALVLHNLFDFNLEFPACAVAMWVALGALARRDERGFALPRRSSPIWAGAAAAVALLAVVHEHRPLAEEEAAVEKAYPNGVGVLEAAKPVMARHPADYVLYSWVAQSFTLPPKPDPAQALAFVNRALYLKPVDYQNHLVAARALLELRHRPQAFLEYRLAYQSALTIDPGTILAESVRRAKSLDELRALVPEAPIPVTQVVERLWGFGRHADARALDEAALGSFPDSKDKAGLWVWQARMLYEDKKIPEATAALDRAEVLDADRQDVAMLRADFLIAAGKPQDAITGLQKLIDRRPEDLELSFALAQDYLRISRPAAAHAVLEKAAAFCSTPEQRARLFSLRGSILEGESMTAKALEEYQAASRVAPDSADLHLQVARVLESLRRYTDAEAEVHAAIRLAPQLASSQQGWISRLEDEDKRAREWAVEQILQAPDGGR